MEQMSAALLSPHPETAASRGRRRIDDRFHPIVDKDQCQLFLRDPPCSIWGKLSTCVGPGVLSPVPAEPLFTMSELPPCLNTPECTDRLIPGSVRRLLITESFDLGVPKQGEARTCWIGALQGQD